MRTPEGDKVYAIVRTHIGAGDAISAPEIAKQLGWRAYRERVVRRIISDEGHLWPNILVCSIPGKGFFCAETYEEAEAYDNWLGDLITSAREKQIIFRVACQKMGFHFTRTNERKAA
jgi:hypothetical protein